MFLALRLEFMQARQRRVDLYDFFPLLVQEHQALVAPSAGEEFSPGEYVRPVVIPLQHLVHACGKRGNAEIVDKVRNALAGP